MLRVQGDSMIDAAILDGDLIVVRPQKTASNGEIVVAMLDGEATVKRFYREDGRVRLQPENPQHGANLRERCRRSSAASRPSSAASSLQSWFEEQFAPAMRWFGELPFVVALREALPWSFLALLAALLVFIPFTPAPGPIFSRSFGLRLSGAFLPSFGIMGMALVPLLAWRYALRAKVSSPPLIAAAVCGYVLSFPPLEGTVFLLRCESSAKAVCFSRSSFADSSPPRLLSRDGWLFRGRRGLAARRPW